jgi:hypothetical protein
MAEESAIRCRTSATRDINTVSRRVKHEGLSFLTITLPDLGKSIQKWIDLEQAGTHPSFQKDGSLPRFLGGYLSRVFDRGTGQLLNDPCIDSIIALRQLTLMFGKILLPCSPARHRRAMHGFIECEKEVRLSDMELTRSDFDEFRVMSNMLFSEVFTQMERDLYYKQILPKHGPGAVADKLTSNGKYLNKSWTRRLENVLPSFEYLIPNLHFREELEQVNLLEPGMETPVKVVSVPKTLKTPRIIAIEPTCMQYMQQALLQCFLKAHGRDELLRTLIGFDDQVPNQELARRGSLNGDTATLDLSDASDRVSNQLVRALVSRWPLLSEAIDATRSRRAEVPGHGVIRLAKYASMGSALCFPIEAMVFTTLIFLGIQRSLNLTMTPKDINSFRHQVRVYGDDLIVPVEHVPIIVQTLEHFGARVGLDKSFWTGKFRESCGKEYYNGVDVSVVRVRRGIPSTLTDVQGVISTVSLRNQLYHAGYWDTVGRLDKHIERTIRFFPYVGPSSPVLGRVSFLGYQTERMHPSLHSPQVRGYVVKAKAPSDPLGGTGALLKCLLSLEARNSTLANDSIVQSIPCYTSGMAQNNEPSRWSLTIGQDERHLERSGRPKHVGIKLGWWSAF